MRKIIILSENLLRDSGGAEVYALKLADVLSHDYDVSLMCKKGRIKAEEIFKKYNTPKINIIDYRALTNSNQLKKHLQNIFTQRKVSNVKCDLFINCTSNRIIAPANIKSCHIIHFPANKYSCFLPRFIGDKLDSRYLNSYQCFIANSEFTKSWIKKRWGVDSKVLNPPIDMRPVGTETIKNKEDIILMVGRLVPHKKIIEAIIAFKKNFEDTGYKLVVIGNSDSNHKDYYKRIMKFCDENIRVISNASYALLLDYYKKAKIFWHFEGYDVNDNDPYMMEHFGMTTVEAMANGCIPIVINKAGQKEIVENGISGFRWDTLEELSEYTNTVIKNSNWVALADTAVERSKKFLIPAFRTNAIRMISELI